MKPKRVPPSGAKGFPSGLVRGALRLGRHNLVLWCEGLEIVLQSVLDAGVSWRGAPRFLNGVYIAAVEAAG